MLIDEKVSLKSFFSFHFIYQPFVVQFRSKVQFCSTFFIIDPSYFLNWVSLYSRCSYYLVIKWTYLLLSFSHPFSILLILLTKLKLFKIPIKMNTKNQSVCIYKTFKSKQRTFIVINISSVVFILIIDWMSQQDKVILNLIVILPLPEPSTSTNTILLVNR